jgi:hypothetical protein
MIERLNLSNDLPISWIEFFLMFASYKLLS